MEELSDPDASQAILIGASRYDHLDDVPAADRNLTDLDKMLTSTTYWGLPTQNCTVVRDFVDHADVTRSVRVAADKVRDRGMLVVYYVGHGVINPDNGSLVLCLQHTDPDRPDERGVPFEWIRRAIAASPARRKLVILDCCYAGRAEVDRLAPLNSDAAEIAVKADMDAIDRTCLLVAAGRTGKASALDDTGHTVFTGALLQVMRDGTDNGQPFLTVEDAWTSARALLAEGAHPVPEIRMRNIGGQMPLVHNARSSHRNLAGSIVITEHGITDPDLGESALLILRHDDSGALGVRLNVPIPMLPDDFSSMWKESVTDLRGIFNGGPVSRDGYIAVARLRPGAHSPRFTPIVDRIGTIAMATPADEIDRCVGDLWIFAGYFGWRAGELEHYLQTGTLIRSAATAASALSMPPTNLWTSLLHQRDRSTGVLRGT